MEIAKAPNVYCKLSGMVTEADWKHCEPQHFKPYLDIVFEAFGAERLMFGSDWPVCLLAASYRQVKQILDDYLDGHPDDEKNKIFGGNAIRFYRLKEVQHGLAA
jgi:L-fuconolactonase